MVKIDVSFKILEREKCPKLTTFHLAHEYAADPYADTYNRPPNRFTPTPPPVVDPYAAETGFYPQTSQFPPPPGSMPPPQPYPVHATAPPPPAAAGYGPQEFPPPPPPPPPGQPGVPGYDAYASGANPYAQRGRGADENVSAVPNPTLANSFPQNTSDNQSRSVPDGTSQSCT